MPNIEPTKLEQLALDLESEQLRPVVEVAAGVLGNRPSKPTVWRWCRKGNRGGRLEAAFVNGKWRTTRATGINPRDARPQPLKKDDHAVDALRYLTYSEASSTGSTPQAIPRERDPARYGIQFVRKPRR
jgi:hypothetical protein